MEDSQQFKYHPKVILVPFMLVFSIWLVFWLELTFHWDLAKHGIYPKRLSGLQGVLFSPFIHGSIEHISNNSIPLAVLTAGLFFFYKEMAFRILVIGCLLTGLLTWIIGRPSYHIGASGVVYLLFSFIFFSGVIRKHIRLIALSLIVVFLYGSMVWYVMPIKEGISWEGHLSGLIVGLFFALVYRKKGPQKKKIVFEHTEFDEMFDANGNFIPSVSEDLNDLG